MGDTARQVEEGCAGPSQEGEIPTLTFQSEREEPQDPLTPADQVTSSDALLGPQDVCLHPSGHSATSSSSSHVEEPSLGSRFLRTIRAKVQSWRGTYDRLARRAPAASTAVFFDTNIDEVDIVPMPGPSSSMEVPTRTLFPPQSAQDFLFADQSSSSPTPTGRNGSEASSERDQPTAAEEANRRAEALRKILEGCDEISTMNNRVSSFVDQLARTVQKICSFHTERAKAWPKTVSKPPIIRTLVEQKIPDAISKMRVATRTIGGSTRVFDNRKKYLIHLCDRVLVACRSLGRDFRKFLERMPPIINDDLEDLKNNLTSSIYEIRVLIMDFQPILDAFGKIEVFRGANARRSDDSLSDSSSMQRIEKELYPAIHFNDFGTPYVPQRRIIQSFSTPTAVVASVVFCLVVLVILVGMAVRRESQLNEILSKMNATEQQPEPEP